MRNIIFLGFFLFSLGALAQGKTLVERSFEGQTKEKNPVAAKKELFEQAVEKVSESLVREIIGDAKYNRNRAVIQSKILKNSARYIPFSKMGELKALDVEGFKAITQLKVNVSDLQAMLLEFGLFYENDGTPMVMPAIRFVDKVNSKTLAWWVANDAAQKPFLAKESYNFENVLRTSFLKTNFYTLKPNAFSFFESVPESLRSESLRIEDWQLLSQKFNAQIVLDGEVSFQKNSERADVYEILMNISAIQTMNGRVVAQITRRFEVDPGPFELMVDKKMKEVMESTTQDLANQILDVWQRGALGASLYKLAVRGRLPITQQEALKDALKNKVREIKNVRERLITAESLVYELDSSIGPKEIAVKMPELELGAFKLVLDSSSEQEIVYKLMKK